ncbi:hypothetical protein BDD12DRAFT_212221 [Trichophaea hybrida]|nr:hypothetical protein BDD12DRAFT_212221 [Trichophaea hybrida]
MLTMNILGKCGQLQWMTHFPEQKLPSSFLCHCVSTPQTSMNVAKNTQESCRKFGAGGYSVNAIIPMNHVKVTKGDSGEYTYTGGSGSPVHCFYCKNCTIHAFHHEEVLGKRYTVHTQLLEGAQEHPEIGMEVFLVEKAGFQPQLVGTKGLRRRMLDGGMGIDYIGIFESNGEWRAVVADPGIG